MNPGGEYPGRQIFAGALRTGEPAFAYFGSGRSPESQERLAVLAADALSVSIRPLRQVPHDKYRHYDAVKIDSETGAAVVSNSQKPLAEAFEACARFAKSGQSSNELQQTLLKILKAIGPEDDEKRTPRILGAVLPNKNLNALAFASESETVCITFPAKPGEFLFVQTYNGIAAGPFDASMLRIGRTVFRTNAANAEQLSVDIYEASDYEDARHGELRVWCAAGVKGDSGWDLKIINKHSARDPLYTKTVAKHPESLIGEKIARELRYGSNPAQPAALYNPESFLGSLREMRTGKEGPSLSNIEDIYYAALTAGYFSEPCVIIMKHANPCGFAVQRRPEPLSLTFMKARDCDYRAAFGGTVFFNVPLDRQTAEEMKSNFTEVVVAPGFDDGVIEMLEGSTRAYQYDEKKFASMPRFSGESSEDEIRRLADGSVISSGTFLSPIRTVQDLEKFVVSGRKPAERELLDMLAGYRIRLRSNSVRMIKDGYSTALVGGQQDRISCIQIAAFKNSFLSQMASEQDIRRAADYDITGSCMISDGFFPFKDSIELANKLGITAILAPHGGRNFREVLKAADNCGMAFVDLPAELRFFSHH